MSQVSQKAVSFEPEEKKEKKEWKINVFAMLLVLLGIAAVITHILPAGKYEQIEKNGYISRVNTDKPTKYLKICK
ncbi:hypothetical protein [Bacillus thuringiensis]|uniref:hypothetical protein n=1 Tax=Bacillus thuringiensis TaxID=1428 RepID=UPI002175E713